MKAKDLLNRIKENEKYREGESVAVSQLTEIFYSDSLHIHPLKMYAVIFNKIPHVYTEKDVDCEKAYEWFIENYESKIENYYIFNIPNIRYSSSDYCEYYLLEENCMIIFNYTSKSVSYFYQTNELEKIYSIVDAIKEFKIEEENNPKISLVINSLNGLSTESMEIAEPKFSIADNYNDDFQETHKIIINRLNKDKDKGLVLLHGKPGTGKTSYIRYLITSVEKKVIFLPPNMASTITNPELLKLLIKHPNTIFVIEDAENIIIDREQNGVSPVSALLNISDGLLSDCLNIQIICSFNTDLSKVDSALMRKGRLIAKYEFKELEVSKAQKLSDKLGFKTRIDQPMTLTDIYNQSEMSFQNEKRKTVGF